MPARDASKEKNNGSGGASAKGANWADTPRLIKKFSHFMLLKLELHFRIFLEHPSYVRKFAKRFKQNV